MTVRVAVNGAGGRMGRAIIAALGEDPAAVLVAALDAQGSDALGSDAGVLVGGAAVGVVVTAGLEEALPICDVLVDFSTPRATRAALEACARHSCAAVVGTTGLGDEEERAAAELARIAPLVLAPNMSIGVTLLFDLAARAAALAGPDFDAEIVEMHHRRKADAPSGTAVRLARVVADAKGLDPGDAVIHGRSGQIGPRPNAQIGVMTLRGGDVVGEHTLVLAGPGERLELTHRAHSRAIFARGAVRAACWVVGQPAGRYDMADVIGVGG